MASQVSKQAIIYARVSSRNQNEDSIDRQIDLCKKLAKKEGYKVIGIYSDLFISGANLKRPGFIQARDELLNNPEVECLLIYKTSRLARSADVLPALLRKMKHPSRRHKRILTTDGFDSLSKSATLLSSVHASVDQIYLENLADDTYTGLDRAFAQQFSTGGKAYGYTSKPLDPKDPKNSRWMKVVDQRQAKIVVEIFERYARGESPKTIAAELNRRGVASPGASWKGRTGKKTTDGKWRGSAINGDVTKGAGILCNPLYNGEYVWNRTAWWKDDDGKRHRVVRPKSEWKRQKMENLRIVPEALWNEVQDRIASVRKGSKELRKKLKVAAGRRNGHLLSGILKCSSCGRSYTVCDGRRYRCSGASDKLCDNLLAVSKRKIEPVVVDTIKDQLLSKAAIELVRKEFRQLLKEEKERRANASPREDLRAKLKDCANRISRIRNAIRLTDDSIEELADDLNAAKREQRELEAQLDTTPTALTELPDAVYKGLDWYAAEVADLRSGVAKPDPEGRRLLQELLGEITVTPYPDEKALELALGINAKALPNVLASGRADAYIVVAGARCPRYSALVTALDILSSGARSKTVNPLPSAP